ncbi:MAD2 mitotic arrest deficient-like 2 [Polyrhizophydium stewartii]|uniref:MAD2 mitotic arrest deficient-like 2 n=1 Tax=Polyrhizophydium stewartii TaxID=2732419 RepID=A0ABR4N004_9FUNG
MSSVGRRGRPETTPLAVGVALDFVQTAVHCMLRQRGVYPPELFQRAAKLGVPVWASRHPDLTAYIASVLDAARVDVLSGRVSQILVSIQDASGVVVELVRFEMAVFDDAESDVDAGELEAHLRACLIKLDAAESSLAPLPPGCTFQMLIEMHEGDDAGPTAGGGALAAQWVPGEAHEGNMSGAGVCQLPLKTIDAGPLWIRVSVLEHRARKADAALTQ